MKKKKSIAKNYIYNLIYQMLTIFLPLITTPYLSRILGAKQIGIYGYTTSIVSYFILFGSLGASMYGQREIAYFQDDIKKRSKVFFEIVILRGFVLVLSLLLFYLIYASGGEYSLYYKILLIQLAANIFDISWLFQGIEEFDKTVIRNLIVKLLCLVLIFVLVKDYNDLWIYFLIYAGAEFVGNLSIWFYLPKYIERVKLKTLNFKKHIKPILSLFLPQIAIQIYTVLDKTMIGVITGDMEEVGYYEQAQKIVKSALLILGALQIVMNSRIANAYAKNDKEEITECLDKSFRFLWFLTIPMMLGLIAVSSKFVPWYYGDGFDSVIGIMVTLAPILLIIGFNGITGNQYLIQIGKSKIYTVSVITGAIVNVIFNTILIYYFNSIGACIASLIAEFTILVIQLVCCRDQFKIIDILKLSIKNWISGFIMFMVLIILVDNLSVSIFSTLIEVLIGGMIYFCCLFILDDHFFKGLIGQIINSLKFKNKIGNK